MVDGALNKQMDSLDIFDLHPRMLLLTRYFRIQPKSNRGALVKRRVTVKKNCKLLHV